MVDSTIRQTRTVLIMGSGLLLAVCAIQGALRAEDRADGKELFQKRCGGCHALDRDKEGPRLGNVYGRTAGAVATFDYSEALRKAKVVWTEATLNQWLTETETIVANNDMAFQVANAGERKAIIAYLKQASGK